MKVTISSIFRNADSYILRYFRQIDALKKEVDVHLVLGHGDSIDTTAYLLEQWAPEYGTLVTHNHGGPDHGHRDHPERWALISQVVRAVVDEVDDPGDAFIWVEADLIWKPEVMLALLAADRIVCPMTFSAQRLMADGTVGYGDDAPSGLYDTWGARQNGKQFLSYPPYFPDGRHAPDEYEPVDSCGSCFVVPARYFDIVRDWDGIWPFTAEGNLVMDAETRIWHP